MSCPEPVDRAIHLGSVRNPWLQSQQTTPRVKPGAMKIQFAAGSDLDVARDRIKVSRHFRDTLFIQLYNIRQPARQQKQPVYTLQLSFQEFKHDFVVAQCATSMPARQGAKSGSTMCRCELGRSSTSILIEGRVGARDERHDRG
jgi:hypothetical protein